MDLDAELLRPEAFHEEARTILFRGRLIDAFNLDHCPRNQDSKVFGIDIQLSMLYKRQESPSFSSSDSQSKGGACVEGEADHNKFIHYHFKSFLEVCYVETKFFISTVAFYRCPLFSSGKLRRKKGSNLWLYYSWP
jgi:hypothetical protein